MTTPTPRPIPHATPDAHRPTARRARLGWSGFLFVFITVFLAIGAVNSQNNLLFWVFGIAVAAVIVSGIISGNSLMGLRYESGEIPDTPAGQTREIVGTVISRNRLLPVFALNIFEIDNRQTRPGCVLHAGPRARVRCTMAWTPTHRGPAEFGRVLIESRFPFGFIIKTLEFSLPRRALATPPEIPLDPAIITALGEGHTEHRVKRARRNATGSYFGLRPYAHGDPRRLIAWKASAKRSELLVVEHAEPRGRSVWVHLPAPRTPLANGDRTAERAIALAAALVREGSRTGRPVGVWAPWAEVRLAPATGAPAERRAARALAMIDLASPTHADSPPPIRPGDSILTIPLHNAGGSTPDRLDPDRPADWLAPGAHLPAILRDPSGEPQR